MARALDSMLVLDVGRVLAGPYAAQLMADFGATVLKIEEPGGEDLRKWAPQTPEGESTNFQSVNRGKQAISLNLKTPEGQDILVGLMRQADVVIHSFLPSVAMRLGLSWDAVRDVNPDLVLCSISGYGSEGPLAAKPGYDLMLQAFVGAMMMTGEPGRGPMRSGFSAIDIATGMLAFGGIQTALLARERGVARGQHVQVSLLESGIALMGYHVTNLLNANFHPSQSGSGVGHIVPYQAFYCADGPLLAGAPSNTAFVRMCEVLEVPELAKDPRFATAEGRREHRDTLIPQLAGRFLSRPAREWSEQLDAAGVPNSPIHTLDQTLAHPQLAATRMTVEVAGKNGWPIHLVGIPVKLSETAGEIGIRPPEAGEHTEAVLRQRLKLDDAQLAQLRARGVI